MADNPFTVKVPNVMEALMAGDQGYKASQDAQKERALADAGKLYASGDVKGALAAAAQGGNLQTLMGLAGLQNNERDFQFRQQESTRAQGNADRSFGLQQQTFEGGKMPAGFQKGPTGGLQPVPGGPEDPAYLRAKTEATDKGRQMSITDITKLTEEGQKFSDLGRFTDTFKPEFAGYGSTAVGNMANIAGRHLPEGIVGKSMAEGSTWWQGYDKYKNVVRHELYGSALTTGETAAFERADITPGMTPEQITKNLALQKTIVENGLKRKASAMVAQGYKPDVIGKAYGVDLGSIGVGTAKTDPAPTTTAPPAASPKGPNKAAQEAARANPAATLEEARAALKANPGAKDIIVYRLKLIGIDPAGL